MRFASRERSECFIEAVRLLLHIREANASFLLAIRPFLLFQKIHYGEEKFKVDFEVWDKVTFRAFKADGFVVFDGGFRCAEEVDAVLFHWVFHFECVVVPIFLVMVFFQKVLTQTKEDLLFDATAFVCRRGDKKVYDGA